MMNMTMRGVALAAALLAGTFAVQAQDMTEGNTLDGATFVLPKVWVQGEPLPLNGTNWTNHDGNRGSVIGVKYDFGDVVPSVPPMRWMISGPASRCPVQGRSALSCLIRMMPAGKSVPRIPSIC